jgi:hypothetical protein
VRDPWFPAILILIVLLGTWLGIFGSLPNGFAAWLQSWQTLAAALVASIAAVIAFRNTSRSLQHAESLERRRRDRKHAAVRAVLPLALSQVTDYAERSARQLNELVGKCIAEALPPRTATPKLIQPLPAETLKTLAEFIEYSDQIDVSLIEATVASIQVHDARTRGIVEDNSDPSNEHIVTQFQLEGRIVDAAAVYAAVGAVYDYARRRKDTLPKAITWDAVAAALDNMRFWQEEFPRLREDIDRRRKLTTGPFENVDLLSLRLNPK